MRRAPILILSVLVLGAATCWLARVADTPSTSTTPAAPSGASDPLASASSALDALAAADHDREASPTTDPATTKLPAEARALAAQPAPILASHALMPDEPTVVFGRIVDRNAAPLSACVVLAAPRAETPPVGLKPGRLWPLEAAPIDRDGARERLRAGTRDLDRDRDDEIARVRKVSTNADGKFEFLGLPSGPIRLALRSNVLAPRDLDDLVLEARGKLDLGDLVLDAPLVLEGEVVDTDGRAIAGARIDRVDSFEAGTPLPGTSVASPLATTAANGRFLTPPLALGAWSLLATHPEHLSQRIDGSCDDPKRTPPAVRFTLRSGITLRGHVLGPEPAELATLCVLAAPDRTWRELDHDPDAELAPESLRLGASADQRVARVASDGGFQLLGLDPERTHTLRVGPLAARGDELACVYLTARADAGAREVDLELSRGATLAFEARTPGSNAPVEDFEVRLFGAAPETLVDENGVAVRHHAAGVFRLTGLRFPGAPPQRLSIAALGHANYTLELRATPGVDITLGSVLLEPLTTLEVTVLDATSGAPIEGARVLSSDDDPVRRASMGWVTDTTDRKGRARVTTYCADSSYVWVKADGFAPAIATIREFERNSVGASCIVRLGSGARVRAHVLDREGAPVPRVSVSAINKVSAIPPVISDAEGIASFEHLYAGSTKFSCILMRAPAPDSASTEVYVGPDADHDVWITSPGIGRLVGRVLDNGRPVLGAELSLYMSIGRGSKFRRLRDQDLVAHTSNDSTAAFRFVGLEPGPFEIAVSVANSVGPIRIPVLVGASETQLDVDISGARWRGRVLDARGHGQGDATVRFSPAEERNVRDTAQVLASGRLSAVSLYSLLSRRNDTGRVGPVLTTDPGGSFEMFVPDEERDFVLFASHRRGGVGSTRVDRSDGGAGTHESTITIAASGALEVSVAEPTWHGTFVIALLQEAEPNAWLMREARSGESMRWDDLAAGEWKAWMIGVWPGAESQGRVLHGPHAIKIEPGRTTETDLQLH